MLKNLSDTHAVNMKIRWIEWNKTPTPNQFAIIHKGTAENSKHLVVISKNQIPKFTNLKETSSKWSPKRNMNSTLDSQLESINILVDEGKSPN